ncbi:MAG: hypothetical protein AB8B51_04530 [Sedimentitalea sp.]
MSDRAMSEEAMLLSLRDIRLPPDAAGGLFADLAVTVGLAALCALAAVAILSLLSVRRTPPPARDLASQLDALADHPEPQRRLALLHLLRDHAPERYANLKGALYQPGGGIDTDMLEAEVARLA